MADDISRKVLLVEDEDEIRKMLAEAFAMKGYDVIAATSGEEALELLTSDIKVMFLDLKLPGKIDGLELCREIRKRNPVACVYAMTGHSSLYELADCREAGFDDYFTKPTRLEIFFMGLEQAFERIERWDKK